MSKINEFIEIIRQTMIEQEIDSASPESVDEQSIYKNLGMDSLSTFTVLSEVESQLGVRLDWKLLNSDKTISEVWNESTAA